MMQARDRDPACITPRCSLEEGEGSDNHYAYDVLSPPPSPLLNVALVGVFVGSRRVVIHRATLGDLECECYPREL